MRNVSKLRSLSLMLSMTALYLVGPGCGGDAPAEPPGAAPPGSSYDAEVAKQKAARTDAKAKPDAPK
jgi:hypothetical protein